MDVFREGKVELLALTEMKLKGNREVSWCVVNGIIAGVQEMERAKEWGDHPVEQCLAQGCGRMWMC